MAARFRSTIPRLLSAAFGLAFGLVSAELSFGQLRPAGRPSDAVLYSIEVRNQAGELLASPMLVGEEGRPLHLSLAREIGPHSEPHGISLDLDPEVTGPDNVCVGYRLSIDDGAPHSGRMGLSYGEERSVQLGGAGDIVRLSLVVARARSKQFERLLHRLRKPAA